MQNDKKEKTAQISSVGADEKQSIPNRSTIITQNDTQINPLSAQYDDFFWEMQRYIDPAYLHTVSMNELYENIYPSRRAVIDNLLYTGTYLFVGAPKVGKSFLMAQIAYHVSMGLPLWENPVHKGTVLYLALEDNHRRLQERLFRMFGTESTDNLRFAIYAKQLSGGLEEQLKGFLSDHPDTRLIIIDTLQKIREAGGDKYCYASDYEVVGKLKRLADEHHVCLLLVHHTRKQHADDRFDMISGTNGLLGAADGAFLLQKEKRTDNSAALEISGRDQQDQRFYLLRDMEKLTWNLEKTETELWKLQPDPLLKSVAVMLQNYPQGWSGTATELAQVLDIDTKANALAMRLNINAGRLLEEHGVRYESSRNHSGRRIVLTPAGPQA